METDNFSNIEGQLPRSVKALIEKNILLTTDPIKADDPETAEFYKELLRDYKTYQYVFLHWLSKAEQLNRILYAGSGFDSLPKLVLGEDKVIHTSLERYQGDTENYFTQLGSGMKVVADNNGLPIQGSVFDTILFFGLPEDRIQKQLPESIRVLNVGGFIVCDSTLLNETDLTPYLDGFEKIEVPTHLQSEGISEVSFSMFKKL